MYRLNHEPDKLFVDSLETKLMGKYPNKSFGFGMKVAYSFGVLSLFIGVLYYGFLNNADPVRAFLDQAAANYNSQDNVLYEVFKFVDPKSFDQDVVMYSYYAPDGSMFRIDEYSDGTKWYDMLLPGGRYVRDDFPNGSVICTDLFEYDSSVYRSFLRVAVDDYSKYEIWGGLDEGTSLVEEDPVYLDLPGDYSELDQAMIFTDSAKGIISSLLDSDEIQYEVTDDEYIFTLPAYWSPENQEMKYFFNKDTYLLNKQEHYYEGELADTRYYIEYRYLDENESEGVFDPENYGLVAYADYSDLPGLYPESGCYDYGTGSERNDFYPGLPEDLRISFEKQITDFKTEMFGVQLDLSYLEDESNWETYVNQTYGYSVLLPSDWGWIGEMMGFGDYYDDMTIIGPADGREYSKYQIYLEAWNDESVNKDEGESWVDLYERLRLDGVSNSKEIGDGYVVYKLSNPEDTIDTYKLFELVDGIVVFGYDSDSWVHQKIVEAVSVL